MENKDKEINFNALTSDILIENKQAYTDALDYAFSNDDIMNIAITGIYGAGKSTVWNTYIQNKSRNKIRESIAGVYKKTGLNLNFLKYIRWNSLNPFKRIITVSLGKYDKFEDYQNTKEIINPDIDSYIERQIINQILLQTKSENIPLSKYRFNGNIPNIKLLWSILLSLLFVGSIIFWLFRDETVDHFKKVFGWFDNSYLFLMCCIMFFFPLGCFLAKFYKENKVKFSKVSFQGAEAKFSDDNNDETVLERNIKEIVYLLDSSKTSAVVFEDLDRFDNVDIFVKLKELNFLLNVYLKANRKGRVVRFVYLIKDGLFSSIDRTKFFDFILPIVPIFDSTTSESHLIDLFMETEEAPEQDILTNISLYINDMRMLRNIVNEYKVYSRIIPLKELMLSQNKLFSLVVVKNIYPNEFDLFQENKGYIKNIFDKIESYRNIVINNHRQERDSILKEIEYLNDSIANDKFEKMALLITSDVQLITQGSKTWTEILKHWSEVSDEEYYISTNFENKHYKYKYKEFLNEFIYKNDNIKEQINISSRTKNERLDKLNKDIEKIENKVKQIRISQIKELILDMSPNQIDDLFENENADTEYSLIRYLIVEGLLDETYGYYKRSFDINNSNILSQKDLIFMKGLLEKGKLEVSLDIESPGEIFNRLTISDFSRYNILNQKLFKVSVQKAIQDDKEFIKIQNMLICVDQNDRYFDLVTVFSSLSYKEVSYCVSKMISNNIKILKKLVSTSDSESFTTLNQIILAIVMDENITKEQVELFIDDIQNNEKIIELVQDDEYMTFIKRLQDKSIKFNDLRNVEFSSSKLIPIEKNHLFKLNINNLICLSTSILNRRIPYAKLLDEMYSNKVFESTREYIDNNFEELITEYLEKSSSSKNYIVKKSLFIKILNSNISIRLKKKFIKYVGMALPELNSLDKSIINLDIIEELFNNKKVRYSNENIQYYWNFIMEYNDNSFDKKKLIDQFVKNFNKRIFNKRDTDISFKKNIFSNKEEICNVIINNEFIGKELFDIIINYATNRITSLNVNFKEDKIRELVFRNMIECNEANIKTMMDKSLIEEIKYLVEENRKEGLLEVSDELIDSIINSSNSTDNVRSSITK